MNTERYLLEVKPLPIDCFNYAYNPSVVAKIFRKAIFFRMMDLFRVYWIIPLIYTCITSDVLGNFNSFAVPHIIWNWMSGLFLQALETFAYWSIWNSSETYCNRPHWKGLNAFYQCSMPEAKYSQLLLSTLWFLTWSLPSAHRSKRESFPFKIVSSPRRQILSLLTMIPLFAIKCRFVSFLLNEYGSQHCCTTAFDWASIVFTSLLMLLH